MLHKLFLEMKSQFKWNNIFTMAMFSLSYRFVSILGFISISNFITIGQLRINSLLSFFV